MCLKYYDRPYHFLLPQFLGYVFLEISTKEIDLIKRELGAFIAFIKYICGPNIFM